MVANDIWEVLSIAAYHSAKELNAAAFENVVVDLETILFGDGPESQLELSFSSLNVPRLVINEAAGGS